VLAKTRTTVGMTTVFGGSLPAVVLCLQRDFTQNDPNTVQALVYASYKTLQWLWSASPEQIAASVPRDDWLGDKSRRSRKR
jgi:NitT/TauT family transport system substrate-binding protein